MNVDKAYRKQLDLVRKRVVDAVLAEFGDAIDPDDIIASFNAFVERATTQIEAGQATAQTLGATYLDLLGGDVIPEDDDIPGTTVAGKTLADGMAPFGPMMLGLIAGGRTIDDAIAYGSTLVGGFADREVTAAADRETERQINADPAAWQWRGIVQPGSCDPCQANAGLHDAEEEIYRHNDCQCDRTWERAATPILTP
jgi:hypothetical protein